MVFGSVGCSILPDEPDPLEVLRVENPSTRFTTELETVEPGRHFRLRLTLKGEGPAGKTTETVVVPEKLESGEVDGAIVIVTNDSEFPRLRVPVKAVVEGRW